MWMKKKKDLCEKDGNKEQVWIKKDLWERRKIRTNVDLKKSLVWERQKIRTSVDK